MSDSIISISLLKGNFDTNTNNSKLMSNILKTQLIFKPKTFKDLYNQIFSDSKSEKNQKILGLLPNEKLEINDNNYEEKKDKIFIYLGCKQEESDEDFDRPLNINDIIIEKGTLDKLNEIKVPSNTKLVESHKKEIEGLKSHLSEEIEQAQNNLFNSFNAEFDESLNENLNKSLNDIVLKFSKKNIQKVENLRNSVKSVSNKFLQRTNSCAALTRKNSEKIKEVKELLKERKDDEKLFEFCDNPISFAEKTNNNKFVVKNIKIKNNSSIDYQSNKLVWVKEKKSNEDLNFDQEEIKNEFAFIKDQIYPKQKEIENLTLNLCIKEPKEQEYKIYLSIKDTETNKIITKKPLEINVKMALDLDYIWKNLKQLEFFKILDKNDEIIKKIKSENGNLSKIKIWVMQEIENKKQSKIKELLNKYQEDFKSNTSAKDESKIKAIILEKKFDEEQIKKWIKENPENDQKAEEIFNKLNDELKADDFLVKKDVIAKIREFNYDFEKSKEWVEDQIFAN